MGAPTYPVPVVRILAVITRHVAALSWATERAIEQWGPTLATSSTFEFRETNYYTAEMGPELNKTFLAFEQPAEAGELADWKLLTNDWEVEFATLGGHAESRPLNLDPGYITPSKLVLASTKDYAHRIYLSQGIYAEITLMWRGGRWQHHDFTFPDYRRADYQQFFTEVREHARRSGKPGLP